MFWTSNVYNFFFKSLDKNVSTQQLYLIYLIFLKFNTRLTFTQFCTYSYIYLNKFNCCGITSLFLGKVFFFKTSKLLQISNVFGGDAQKCQNTLINQKNFNHSFFWKKFQKLKRPKTEDNYDEYFIKDLRTKITKYNKLGFLVIFNSFFLVRVRSENFLKNLVNFNKPLLISPKYSSSSINKYVCVDNVENFEFQFLRKNKVYNKGRYSRCRQNYRTGVYMCMYLSVVSIFGLYYWFYKFSFNFTYLWWLFIAFIASFFLPKVIKYRLYEPMTFISKVFDFFKWGFMIIKSIFF